MITYYQKKEVLSTFELCEAIEQSLTEVLVNVNQLSVYYHAPALQLRIVIEYENGKRIFIPIESEDYQYLLNTNASMWEYDYFITHLKFKIKSMILKDYIK